MARGTQGPASLIGQVVGGYRLERVLGKGATGAVFLGRWVQGERPRIEQVGGLSVELPEAVAVKVLMLPWQLDEAERADFRARFLREAETQQQRLRHPHVVTVLASGEDVASGLIYMAQPYLQGGTLAERPATLPSLRLISHRAPSYQPILSPRRPAAPAGHGRCGQGI